jgi:hypothetical protein
MDPTTSSDSTGAEKNQRSNIQTSRLKTTSSFGPWALYFSGAPEGRHPRVWRAHSRRPSCSLPIKRSSSHHWRLGFCLDKSLASSNFLATRVSIQTTWLLVSETPNSWLHISSLGQGLCTVCLSTCSCLFFNLLAGSRFFLARQEQQQIGAGVTVTKAQCPCCSL